MTVPSCAATSRSFEASGFNVTPPSVELQRKLAFPFVTLVMALLAIPFGVSVGTSRRTLRRRALES